MDMKILIVSTSYPPYISGVATSTFNLVQELSKKYSVSLISSTANKHPQKKIVTKNLQLYLLPGVLFKKKKHNFTLSYPYPKKIENIIRNINPDIIHLQDFSPISLSSASFAKNYHIPIIITHHFTAEFIYKSLIPTQELSNKISQIQSAKKFVYRLVNLFYNQYQLVTVPNKSLIPYLQSAKLKTPIVSISNGINISSFNKKIKLSSILKRYKITQPKIILFVGRLEIDKSISLLIKAFKDIYYHNPDTSLVLVGEGSQKKKLKKLAKKLGIDQATYFLGGINNQDHSLSHLYNSAHLFTNPSIIENQSMTFLEASTAGLPLVTANTKTQYDLLKPNINTVVFEPDSHSSLSTAIQKLLLSHKLRKTLSKNNKKLAQKHDISITSQQYLKAYQTLLQTKTPR